MKKLFFITLALLIVVPAAVFAVGEKEEVEDSGVIKYYTDNDESELDPFASAISAGTGVKLEPLRLSSGEAWARVDAEAPNIGADMHFGWPLSFALMAKEKGLLMSYKSSAWDDIPDQYKDPDGY